MIFKLIIDRNAEENVTATVHGRSQLIDDIELLCLKDSGAEAINAYKDDEVKKLGYNEIECITVIDGKTVAIDRKNESYRLKYRLYEIEEILPTQFVRINKSAIANESRIEKFTVSFGGAVDVIFKSGYRDTISRRCFQQLKRRFDL